jgi:hypothetical protein
MAFHVPSIPATSYETPGICLFLCTFATDADLLELWHPKQRGCEDDASTDAPILALLKQAVPATGLSILVLAAVEYIDGITAHPTQHVRHYVKDHFLQRTVSGFRPSSLELDVLLDVWIHESIPSLHQVRLNGHYVNQTWNYYLFHSQLPLSTYLLQLAIPKPVVGHSQGCYHYHCPNWYHL